jgi:hypothetical protein
MLKTLFIFVTFCVGCLMAAAGSASSTKTVAIEQTKPIKKIHFTVISFDQEASENTKALFDQICDMCVLKLFVVNAKNLLEVLEPKLNTKTHIYLFTSNPKTSPVLRKKINELENRLKNQFVVVPTGDFDQTTHFRQTTFADWDFETKNGSHYLVAHLTDEGKVPPTTPIGSPYLGAFPKLRPTLLEKSQASAAFFAYRLGVQILRMNGWKGLRERIDSVRRKKLFKTPNMELFFMARPRHSKHPNTY